MILKYYCNGWNYIDEVENVKWFNIDLKKIYKKGLEEDSEKIDLTYDSQGVVVGIQGYSRHRETRKWKNENDPMITFHNLINNQINHRLLKVEELKFHPTIYTKIEKRQVIELLASLENPNIPCQNNFNYARVLVFDKNDTRNGILFLNTGYLLNNQGQTIEKIG